jgi:hypothetical protein
MHTFPSLPIERKFPSSGGVPAGRGGFSSRRDLVSKPAQVRNVFTSLRPRRPESYARTGEANHITRATDAIPPSSK